MPLREWIKIKDERLNEYLQEQAFHDDPEEAEYNQIHFYNEIQELQEYLDKNPDAILMQFKNLKKNEISEINKFSGESSLYAHEDANFPIYYPNNTYKPEQHLKQLNIFEPVKTEDNIRKIFNRTIFFVNTHENYKFLKQNFALALSDEEESMEFFELFINNINPSLKKLKNELRMG